MLLTNADLSSKFDGWEGQLPTGWGTSETSTLHAAECLSATMDMHQTLTGLPNGIYELQVNGAFRPSPYTDFYNVNYAATLYANGIHNYFQTNIEDMISPEEAIDGENCNITGPVADFAVTDEDGELAGYTMQGIVSCCNAFQAGRYQNSVLCKVTDGTLTVGIRQPGTGLAGDWLGFGNIRVFYYGQPDEAAESLDRVLASQSSRANTILNDYEFDFTDNYAAYPNFSQALKDELRQTLEAVATATEPEAKYQLVEKFSSLFLQIYECKQAYVTLMDKTEEVNNLLDAFSSILSEDEFNELDDLYTLLINGYIDGSMSAEEALAVDPKSHINFFPDEEDGYYLLRTPKDYFIFARLVGGGTTKANAKLVADIDLRESDYPALMIGSEDAQFAGTFDGQGHTVSYSYEVGDNYGGLFRYLDGATIRNLRVEGDAVVQGIHFGALAGWVNGTTLIEKVVTNVNITGDRSGVTGNGGMFGRLEGQVTFNDCATLGSMGSPGSSMYCGFVAFAGAGSSTLNNCFTTSTLTEGTATDYCYTFCRGTAKLNNCYYLNAIGAAQGTQMTLEQFRSGEVCYKLNGDQSVIRWTQTIGVDKEPVRGTDSEQVYAHGQMLCDGTSAPGTLYNNVGPDGIIKLDHEFDEEGYCIYCGAMCGEIVPTADGWYEISTPFEFRWFAHYVNDGNNSINGRLTCDIDLSNIAWEPIGTFGDAASNVGIQMPFRGVFDGQNHTVYNLNVLTSDARETGLFGRVNGGATIRNIGIVNASIQSEGNGRAGVLAGEIHQSTVTNAFTGGNIVINSGYFQTGGLAGEAASSTLTNCYTTYPILTNNAGALVNCYWGEEIAAQAATGELCYRMNGGTFLNAKWYQTLDEDPCPLLDSSHGLVYPTYDDKYLSASTDEEREKMVGNVIDYESDLYETMIATRVLKDNYTNQLATLMDLPFDEFIAGYARLNGLRDAVKSSETAYANYMNKVKEVSDYLEENQNFGGTDRAVLVDYLTEEIAPNEVYPNGSYLYIVDELVLGIVEIAEEINFVQHLLDMAIAHGYQAGSEITNILTNPDFDGSSEGWTYDMGRQNNITALPDMKSVVSVQDSKLDVNQTLAKPLPGIYEFRINGYAETEGLLETCTYNYGAFVYANGNRNYLHTKYTSLLSEEEAADYPNDFAETFLNVGEDTGWGPKGFNGVVRAFNMGHYLNRILVNVQDGEDLKLGVLTLGSDTRNNDTFFGGARLFYWGTLEEAEEAIEEQLTDMLAIAHHIQDDYPYSESDYESAPNFSAELRDRNSELISRASDATSVQEKYDIIVAFGELFGKIYDCKKSYLNMISLTDKLFEAVCEHGDEAEADEFQNNFYDPIIDAYDNCAYTQQEAEEMTRKLKENVYYLTEFGEEPELVDGVYQITSPYNLSWLAYQVNERGIRNQRVALANDIRTGNGPLRSVRRGDNQQPRFRGRYYQQRVRRPCRCAGRRATSMHHHQLLLGRQHLRHDREQPEGWLGRRRGSVEVPELLHRAR